MSDEFPRSLKFATVWLLLGTAVFLGLQWQQREARKATFSAVGDVVEIRRADDGHYHWAGKLNGRPVEFLVDTGATGVAIPTELATRLGLVSEGSVRSSTAGELGFDPSCVAGDHGQVDLDPFHQGGGGHRKLS